MWLRDGHAPRLLLALSLRPRSGAWRSASRCVLSAGCAAEEESLALVTIPGSLQPTRPDRTLRREPRGETAIAVPKSHKVSPWPPHSRSEKPAPGAPSARRPANPLGRSALTTRRESAAARPAHVRRLVRAAPARAWPPSW